MRILFLAPEPFFEVRGTPINIRQLLYSIGDMGHKVDLLTYHIGKDVSLKNVNIYRIAKVPFVRYVPIGPSFVKIILDPFLFLKSIKMVISERYDLIHAVEESAFIAFVIKKLFKVPYIYDMDSCISDQLAYTGKLKNRLLLKSISSLEKIVIRNSLTVLTVCSALTELAACAAPGKKNFQVEDCAIEFPEKKTELARKKFGISEDSIIVMYVGNFETYQGIEMLLESLSIVLKDEKNVRLLLIGGEPQQIQRLRAYAGRVGILGSVSFQGKKAFEEIPSYLRVADILVSPRLKGTNTPMKIFYYLASGKPVVATDLPMHNQVLNDKVAKLTEPDARHFSEGILHFVKDSHARDKTGEEGRKLFESKYSASIFGEKVREVYQFVTDFLEEQYS